MEKERGITIGTIGHVDHGKTTLTAAIQQVLKPNLIDEFEIVAQGRVFSKNRRLNHLEEILDFEIKEYVLIKQKTSKLSRNRRDFIERKIDRMISEGKISKP